MPPRRNKSSGAAGTRSSSAGQSILSFNNRVKKPGQSQPQQEVKASKTRLSDAAQDEVVSAISAPRGEEGEEEEGKKIGNDDDEVKETTIVKITDEDDAQEDAEAPQIQLRKTSKKKKSRTSTGSLGEEEFEKATSQAQKISDARIKKYWKAEEDARLAPRIHQKGVHMHEKILRHFDLSSQYGPCIGIPRLQRWRRAFGLGLGPPIEVFAVLLKEEAKGADKGDKGRVVGKIAYVDELGGGGGGGLVE